MARQLGASVAVNLQAMPLTVIKTMPTPVKEKKSALFFCSTTAIVLCPIAFPIARIVTNGLPRVQKPIMA